MSSSGSTSTTSSSSSLASEVCHNDVVLAFVPEGLDAVCRQPTISIQAEKKPCGIAHCQSRAHWQPGPLPSEVYVALSFACGPCGHLVTSDEHGDGEHVVVGCSVYVPQTQMTTMTVTTMMMMTMVMPMAIVTMAVDLYL